MTQSSCDDTNPGTQSQVVALIRTMLAPPHVAVHVSLFCAGAHGVLISGLAQLTAAHRTHVLMS